MLLNENYIVSKFYQYAGYPKYNKTTKAYFGGCPTCREGKSWGKKRRLYFIVKKNLIFCHNCGISMRPIKWIQQVTNLSYVEIMKENNQFLEPEITYQHNLAEEVQIVNLDNTLPEDSINLSDISQLSYYKDNTTVQAALKLIDMRRLNKACNRPTTFWISLTDKIHKNRLIIPFYDSANKIVHYQSRTIFENNNNPLPKYLSKQNSEKTLFGINNIDASKKYIFITEGPLDACFIKNGVAVAGINEGKGALFTAKQKEQLKHFPLLEHVWVLDNQRIDSASKKKTKFLLKNGCKVFIWPSELKNNKDINDVCKQHKINEISEKFILDNVYSGLKGSMLLAKLN